MAKKIYDHTRNLHVGDLSHEKLEGEFHQIRNGTTVTAFVFTTKDAHLYSAAPDMLEALDAFKSAFKNFSGFIHAKSRPARIAMYVAIEKAKNAMAKAKGEMEAAPTVAAMEVVQ